MTSIWKLNDCNGNFIFRLLKVQGLFHIGDNETIALLLSPVNGLFGVIVLAFSKLTNERFKSSIDPYKETYFFVCYLEPIKKIQ